MFMILLFAVMLIFEILHNFVFHYEVTWVCKVVLVTNTIGLVLSIVRFVRLP